MNVFILEAVETCSRVHVDRADVASLSPFMRWHRLRSRGIFRLFVEGIISKRGRDLIFRSVGWIDSILSSPTEGSANTIRDGRRRRTTWESGALGGRRVELEVKSQILRSWLRCL